MKIFFITIGTAAAIGFVALLVYFAHAAGVPLLNPTGAIGIAERDLMVHTVLLMLIVGVPVYILIVVIAIRYRAGAKKASYLPNWENSPMEEFIWWIIPIEIVLVLGALTWSGTHALAPEKAIQSSQKPEVVQVVALPWKWLFIYPEEGIATVNELAIPAGRPISFEITAAAPMNSFWIPALGGQMYAMTGMVTRLNLISDQPGEVSGRSANYSGEGFANMSFPVHVLAADDWDAWVGRVYASANALTPDVYSALAKPSEDTNVQYFGSVKQSFADIVQTYMSMPATSTMHMPEDMPDMNMKDMHMH